MSTVNTDNDIFASLGLVRELETKKNDELGQEDFLELMITQLKNQDPFSPMENGDFLAQIAQFSSVSGINQLNNSFADLASSLTSNQALQAGALVGREVLAPLDYGLLPADGALRGEIDLPASTGNLVLTVSDASGALVRELQLGVQPAGKFKFSWDGLDDNGEFAPPGVYRIQAQGIYDGEPTALETLIAARVDSVSLGADKQDFKLNLDGLGPISLNDVAQIY